MLEFSTDVRRVRVAGPSLLLGMIEGHLLEFNCDRAEVESGVCQVCERLAGLGIVRPEGAGPEPASGGAQRCASPSQLAYLERITLEPNAAQLAIESSSVLILGVGGVGSVILQHLVAAGVRRLTLVDYDVVEESNLGRQFIHSLDTCGDSKLQSALRYVARHSADAQVNVIEAEITSADDVRSILVEAGRLDGAAVCIDDPPGTSFDICATALWEAGVPFVHGGLMTQSGFFGPMFSAGHGTPHPSRFPIGDAERVSRLDACFAPYNTMLGAQIAADLIHHLAGVHDLVDYSARTFVDWRDGRRVRIEALD